MNAITNVVGQSLEDGARVARLKKAVDEATYGGCIERAVLWSEYYMDEANDGKSTAVQIAEATRHVLANKTVKIYPDELIVGNFTAKRVAGICYPEFGGLGIMIGVDKLPTRKVNPLEISEDEQAKLQSYIPFWMDKYMVYLAFDGQEEQMRFIKEQTEALQYQLYEAGGIAHLAPGYEKVIKLGAEGIIAEVGAFERKPTIPQAGLLPVCENLNECAGEFGDRYATEARRLAEAEADPQRKLDLERIAEVCARVPRYGATSFYEAVNQ
jgi:formate C-acetyltransferase